MIEQAAMPKGLNTDVSAQRQLFIAV
jgi:hypothetical protein